MRWRPSRRIRHSSCHRESSSPFSSSWPSWPPSGSAARAPPEVVMSFRRVVPSAPLLLVAVVCGACARKQAAPPPPVAVEVVPVVQKDVPIVGEWIGTLDGSVNADIRPKVEGYVLRQFY